MKTDDLVKILAADIGSATPRPRPFIMGALLVGAVLSLALFVGAVGLRGDIANVFLTLRFWVKFIVTLGLAVAALALSTQLAGPDSTPDRRLLLLAVPPAILVLAVALELDVTPPGSWWTRLLGVNARYCVALIPLLSAAPLASLIYAMRACAPADRELSGLLAGLAAGGVGAAIYALHCTDDSPLFLAAWYSLGIGVVALIGAWLGPRLLDW